MNQHSLKLSGIEGIFFMLAISFLFGILSAARFGGKDTLPTNYMVKVNNIISFILFLFPYKRKVTIWALIMQVFNYIAIASAIIIYKVLGLNSKIIYRIFALIIIVYMGISIILLIIDSLIYDIRKK